MSTKPWAIQNGLFVVTNLLNQDLALKVLVVSAITTGAVPRQMLRAGALGYLTKGSVRGIRQVAKGERYIDESLGGADLFGDSGFDGLNGRVRDVLLRMLEGMQNPEIAAALGISESTVRRHKAQ